ncbi:uncharacterized protein AMSG_08483 [Thecamonas trahens ATCC 50062]|uniref:SET domain-containing protein n=1 Tax=Thecamonas trahens ATCC 50062 TaxID=461836 RepID=A0A0L0DMK6_THETB|nr:hypothetical protein AMSG_08483 [Thecamonas trahens ATCC 50062]KNC52618.1 hypothetical protein AMSG_08483 [Thecamonas trahens ATCC 50062]|eukprot:XP_013755175.1 hypothetical protein AMSG_08483 [Thecamonas trahens ATCC 50062]
MSTPPTTTAATPAAATLEATTSATGATGASEGGKKKKKKNKKRKKGKVLEASWPLRSKTTAERGTYVYVTDKVEAGTVLLAEAPFVWSPMAALASRICANCSAFLQQFPPQVISTCSSCRSAYCSAACEAAAGHADYCAPLSALFAMQPRAGGQELVMVGLIIKAIVRAAAPPPPTPSAADAATLGSIAIARATRAEFDALPTHREATPEQRIQSARAQFEAALSVPQFAALMEPYGTPDDLVELAIDNMCRINTNSAPLPGHVLSFPSMGTGISLLQPQSRTRARPTRRGSPALTVGDEVTCSCIDAAQPFAQRQELLASQRGITCACPRCAAGLAGDGPLGGIVCPACATDATDANPVICVPGGEPLVYTCPTCGDARDVDVVSALLYPLKNRLRNLRIAAQARDADSVGILADTLIAEAAGVLHPHHFLLLSAYPLAANAALQAGNLPKALGFFRLYYAAQRVASPTVDIETIEAGQSLAEHVASYLQHSRRLPTKLKRALISEFRATMSAIVADATILFGDTDPRAVQLKSMATPGWQAPPPPQAQAAQRRGAQSGSGHGHTHGGKPCHGHGGGASSSTGTPPHGHSHSHSHSHGGDGGGHGHTHGGEPCHGHGGHGHSH